MNYIAVKFPGKSRAATGSDVPPGLTAKASKTKDHPAFNGLNYDGKHCGKVKVVHVWLCEDNGPDKAPTKRRIIHEASGPMANKVADDFIAMWKPESPEQKPPMCPAEGFNPKPQLDPEIQPCLL